MPLGNSNIGISSIKGEIESAGTAGLSNKISVLSSDPIIQKYSFYAPGNLSVDAAKNAILTSQIDSYKFGEFRSYYQGPQLPSPAQTFSHDWGPGGTTTSFILPWFPEQLNIWEFIVPGDYITQKYYLNETDRINETNVYKTQRNDITFSTITPLPGHSRNTTKRASSTQIPQTLNFNTGGLSTPNDTVYADTYISDLDDNRKINLGADKLSGYTDMSFHERQQPYIQSGGSIVPPPSGITAALTEIFTSSSPLCQSTENIDQTLGSSNVSFYVHIIGIKGPNEVLGSSSCDINLYFNGIPELMYSGSLSHSINTQISHTLTAGKTWQYGDIGTVKIENNTWSGLTTVC